MFTLTPEFLSGWFSGWFSGQNFSSDNHLTINSPLVQFGGA